MQASINLAVQYRVRGANTDLLHAAVSSTSRQRLTKPIVVQGGKLATSIALFSVTQHFCKNPLYIIESARVFEYYVSVKTAEPYDTNTFHNGMFL